MYAKPLRDLSFLVGRELTQICVGRYEVILNFDGNTSATILGQFTLDDRDLGELPDAARYLFPLLGAKVESAAMVDGGHARIEFPAARALLLVNDAANYEAYRIVAPGHDVIV